MPIVYSGNTPIIKGRSTSDFVHPYKGLGTYSNWSIFAGNGPLADMPEKEDHVPGTGRHPHGLQLSQQFMGLDNEMHPMADPGSGPELTWHTSYKDAFALKGKDGQDIFPRDFGHEKRDSSYALKDPWTFRGVAAAPLEDVGHEQRLFNVGTANWVGATHPYDYGSKSVSGTPLEDPGAPIDDKPSGLDHAFQRVNEWKGVPSARAL